MVSQKFTFVNDYTGITEHCGLIDASERGKLMLTGKDARSFLQGQVSNDVEGLEPGTGCYAAFLTPKGKMLGDLRILATDDALLLDTERVALQELFNMIRRFSVGYDVELHKRTLEAGLLSLLGPGSFEIAGLADAPEHAHELIETGGIASRAIRTNLGVDLLCEAADTDALRAALQRAGVVEVSPEIAELLRIESGRPRYGVDIDDSVIPQEAGLNERAVSFTKGCYVGQETVARLFYRGKPNRMLRGLKLSKLVATGTEFELDGRPVGTVTSAAESLRYGPIGLALIRREAPPGSVVTAQAAADVSATVVELPFAD
jgi:tRNA-modifying protein YgfZ